MGSCGTYPTRRPRIGRRARSSSASRSCPASSTRPVTRAARPESRSTARARVVLPLPDSPSRTRAPPGSRVSETPSTARVGGFPRPAWSTVRSRTASSRHPRHRVTSASSPCGAAAQRLAEAVEEHGDGEDDQRGQHRDARVGQQARPRLLEHRAPFGVRRGDAEAEEGQAGRVDDGQAHQGRAVDQHDRRDDRQDLPYGDREPPGAAHPGGLQVFGGADAAYFGVDDPGHRGRQHHRQRDDNGSETGVQHGRDREGHQDAGEGVEDVEGAQQRLLGDASAETRGDARGGAEDRGDADRCEPADQRGPGAPQQPAEHVPALPVGAQQVPGAAGREQAVTQAAVERAVRGEQRGGERRGEQQHAERGRHQQPGAGPRPAGRGGRFCQVGGGCARKVCHLLLRTRGSTAAWAVSTRMLTPTKKTAVSRTPPSTRGRSRAVSAL